MGLGRHTLNFRFVWLDLDEQPHQSVPEMIQRLKQHLRLTVVSFDGLVEGTREAVDRGQALGHHITPPENITPPPDTPPHRWYDIPLGATSTPLRTPVVRPRPEPFALIHQLLVAMRNCEDGNLTSVTEHFANDLIFRERLLSELDDLRSVVVGQPSNSVSAVEQTLQDVLYRIEQAETTLSLIINNLQHLENFK
uniref:Uncharacterized protein n=1 Tax=Anopheles farauti TaxID=69004 RepID=A0A182QPS7_9DIPT